MSNIEAIITKFSDTKREVRCGTCGKLLFVTDGIFKNNVDISSQDVIIVARCTRNSCKTDNCVKLKMVFS